MQEFELCYRIAEDVFIVPDLLTVEEQPVPGFGYDTALRFVLQYDFLPASVLPRFMVQLRTRIVEGEQAHGHGPRRPHLQGQGCGEGRPGREAPLPLSG